MMEGMSLTQVHYKHMWKYHSEFPLYDEYMLYKMGRECSHRKL
jgi:hypothetical protein